MQDKELLNPMKNNPEKGYRQLLRQYSGLVFTIVYSKLSLVCTKEDAEECAADVFIKFYKNVSSIDLSKGSVKAFLSVIAKRAAITRFHALTKNKPELISIDDEESSIQELQAEENDSLLRETLIGAIQTLGEPDCKIITKKFFGGETAKQIASELGMNEYTVHKRIRRALEKLKKILMEVDNHEE